MYDPMVTFIHHKKLCMVSQSYTEKVCLSREKLLKYYDIFNKSWVKKGSKLNNAYNGNEIWWKNRKKSESTDLIK